MLQDGLVPPLEPQEASGLITASEQIIKEYASKVGLNAQQIKALIEDVLHNPAFNADDVDTDMLKRFSAAIDSGDLEIISMHHAARVTERRRKRRKSQEKLRPC
jgi:hypothetical protein